MAQPSTSPSPSDKAMASQRAHILLVEDNRADVYLLREAIVAAHTDAELHVVTDGEKAIKFIEDSDAAAEPCPNLVVLDLNLPKKSGAEVLEHLRASTTCRDAAVLIVTSSDSEKDKAETTRMGANGYFRKPSSYDAFMKLGEVVRDMLAASRTRQAAPDS